MYLSVRPNSRQIPNHQEYTANKLYDDMLYGYLQSISLPGEDGIRFVKASECSGPKLEAALGASRQTMKKRFKGLQDLLLVGEKQNGKYELLLTANEYSYLVPLDVLEALLRIGMPRTISLYVKFLSLANKGDIEYNFTTMKNYVGLSTATYSNSHLITEPLEAMASIGLLKHRQVTFNEDGRIVTKQYVSDVVNYL